MMRLDAGVARVLAMKHGGRVTDYMPWHGKGDEPASPEDVMEELTKTARSRR